MANGIYKFENKINGMIYIGQANNLEVRYKKHYNNIKDLAHQENFYKGLREYGWENFSYEIIESFPDNDYDRNRLNDLEIYYIDYYNSLTPNGYNMTLGGNIGGGYVQRIPISVYDLKGNFIKTYESIAEAVRQLNLNINSRANISACCKGERNYAFNYQWRYAKDNIEQLDNIEEKIFKTNIPILQYDMHGIFINKYANLQDACKKTGYSKSGLCQALKGIVNSCHNYQWKYEDDIREIKPINKTFLQIDKKSKQIINKFETLTEAYETTKIHRGNIGECLKGKRLSAGGYIWKYEEF